LAAALAGCGAGFTGDATRVTDVGATVGGSISTAKDDELTWWVEWGLTTAYGNRTPDAKLQTRQDQHQFVSANILGLSHGATHHYRVCARGTDGGGICGADRVLTTTAGEDSAVGQGIVDSIPQLGFYDGSNLDAYGPPGGGAPHGRASISPGSAYFRIPDQGPVTCLRVEGNRAVVGFKGEEFTSGIEPIPGALVFIEDNGPTGDREKHRGLTAPPATCPAFETEGLRAVIDGDFRVHDHPAAQPSGR
jgi:hypothetical protein